MASIFYIQNLWYEILIHYWFLWNVSDHSNIPFMQPGSHGNFVGGPIVESLNNPGASHCCRTLEYSFGSIDSRHAFATFRRILSLRLTPISSSEKEKFWEFRLWASTPDPPPPVSWDIFSCSNADKEICWVSLMGLIMTALFGTASSFKIFLFWLY